MSAWSDAVAALAPYGWWKLDEASGTVIVDSGSGAHNGTYSGTPTFSQASLIPGDSGSSSILLDALVDKATFASLSFSSTNVTFATTFKSATDQVGRFFNITSTRYLDIAASSSSAVIEGVAHNLGYDPTALFDGNAHLLVYVVRATSVELWVDGAMVGSATHSQTGSTRNGFTLNGTSTGIGPIGGYDDVLLWTSALSSTQLGDLYDGWSGNSALPAALTGSGALTAATAGAVAAALLGAGVFSASVVPVESRSADLAGSGAFTAIAYAAGDAIPVDANLTGSGGFSASAFGAYQRDAALGGTGQFTAVADIVIARAANLTGSGAFSASVRVMPITARNRVGGRVRRGVGVVDYSPPIVAAPTGTTLGVEKEVAQAFGPVTISGTRPTFTVAEASTIRDTDRILVGGKDITWWRGVHTPTPDFSLIQPLLYGSGALRLPQLVVPFEQPGVGALRFLAKGKPVVVQRVRAGVVVATDYKGFIVDWNVSGGEFTAQLGGEASGRAALMNKQVPVYRQRMDAGKWAYFALGASGLGLPFRPYLGIETGIQITSRGGMSMLDYINELCALAVKRNGDQYTIVPGTAGKYHMELKDRTTIDATVYFDDARLKPDLRSDIAEEPNRVFVTGVTPAGQKVKFGRYPGLLQGKPPPFPGFMTEGATGDGVTALIWRLRVVGYLNGEDAPGGYDEDVSDAIKMLQSDAGLTQTGNVNLDTWRALYDLEVTGYSMTGSAIHPTAQDSSVREFHHSPTGSRTHRNPNYRPGKPKVDINIDMGTGFTRQQMREMARNEKQAADTDNWVGTLDLNLALIEGEHVPGAPITSADVMQRRELRPGMNVWAPQFMGGTLFHVSGVEVRDDGRSVSVSLDTRARDTMKVWQIITRNRESRHNPARAWMNQYRSSTIPKDGIVTWDEVGGVITGDVTLAAGKWTVFRVVAGEEGTVSRFRLRLADDVEFACAVFGKKISEARLNKWVPAPLAKTRNDREGTGEPWYEKRVIRDKLRSKYVLLAEGTHDEPCGRGPARKTDANGNATNAPLTGEFDDEAGFSFRTQAEPVLYVAVWTATATSVEAGRIMWPQREEGS